MWRVWLTAGTLATASIASLSQRSNDHDRTSLSSSFSQFSGLMKRSLLEKKQLLCDRFSIMTVGAIERMPEPPNLHIPTRNQQLEKLKQKDQEWDVLVIGGGATGTGIALDAASRGLKVALVERDDFSSGKLDSFVSATRKRFEIERALSFERTLRITPYLKGTSSRSTKLIHGGVRYLEKALRNLDKEQFNMVREALHERSTLIKSAPHLAYELPIMLPVYSWFKLPYYYAGAKLYDLFAGQHNLQSSYYLNKRQALECFPHLKQESLKGAVVYYDGAHNDARMNVSLALTAASEGATVANHVEVLSLLKETLTDSNSGKQRLCGAELKDTLTGQTWNVRAKAIVNATGPFCGL